MGRLLLILLLVVGSTASATMAGPGSVLDLKAAGFTTELTPTENPTPKLGSRLSPELRSCLFQNTLAFGASITSATPAMIPFFNYAVKKYE